MYLFFKKFTSILITSLLLCSFIATPISVTLTTQRAEALTVWDPGNYIPNYGTLVQSAISAAMSQIISKATDALFWKEMMDGITWQIVNLLIQNMIRSTTQWVKSGFNGSPAFVQDLNGFMTNIADQVAGDFIYKSGLGMLCSPFKLNIQLALNIQYNQKKSYKTKCTLSGVINNVDSFFNGNFLAGGWKGWYAVTMNPQNNPYGSMLEAQTALSIRISGAQSAEMKLLDFGKGFLSVKDPSCNADHGPCKVVTPGTAIESILNSSLNLPNQRIAAADEINELIGALFQQLAGQVLGGVGGLLGLNSADSNGQTFFDRHENDSSGSGYAVTSYAPIQTSIDNETRYLRSQTQIIALIQEASTYKSTMYPDEDTDGDGTVEENTCHSGALTTSLSTQLTGAQQGITATQSTIDILNTLQTDYKQLTSASSSQTVTANLLTKYSAKSIPEAQARVLDYYGSLNTSQSLHSVGDIVTLEMQTLPDLKKEIKTFKSAIDKACRTRGGYIGG